MNAKFSPTGAQASGKHQLRGDANNPHCHYRKNKKTVSLLDAAHRTIYIQFSTAVFFLSRQHPSYSQSLLSHPLANNFFNCVIHYFPIISRKGHILLIKCINLNLIYYMFSTSPKIKKTFKVSITKQIILSLYLFIKQKLHCRERKKKSLLLLKCYVK